MGFSYEGLADDFSGTFSSAFSIEKSESFLARSFFNLKCLFIIIASVPQCCLRCVESQVVTTSFTIAYLNCVNRVKRNTRQRVLKN